MEWVNYGHSVCCMNINFGKPEVSNHYHQYSLFSLCLSTCNSKYQFEFLVKLSYLTSFKEENFEIDFKEENIFLSSFGDSHFISDSISVSKSHFIKLSLDKMYFLMLDSRAGLMMNLHIKLSSLLLRLR